MIFTALELNLSLGTRSEFPSLSWLLINQNGADCPDLKHFSRFGKSLHLPMVFLDYHIVGFASSAPKFSSHGCLKMSHR
jgi:hypothetical protein